MKPGHGCSKSRWRFKRGLMTYDELSTLKDKLPFGGRTPSWKFVKYGTNRFHKLQLLFWIKRSLWKEKFLDLKQCREVHTLKEGFQTMEMRSIFMQDKRKQLLRQFYVVLQSKQGIGGEN